MWVSSGSNFTNAKKQPHVSPIFRYVQEDIANMTCHVPIKWLLPDFHIKRWRGQRWHSDSHQGQISISFCYAKSSCFFKDTSNISSSLAADQSCQFFMADQIISICDHGNRKKSNHDLCQILTKWFECLNLNRPETQYCDERETGNSTIKYLCRPDM